MRPKTERYSVKLLKSDKRALQRLAHEEGESMAVVVRRLIREAAEREPVPAGQGGQHDRQ